MTETFWNLIRDPDADPVVVRVYRWLHQWPESIAFPTMVDPAEMARGTGFSVEAIAGALTELVRRGWVTLYAERPDGILWVHLVLNPPGDRPPLASEPSAPVPPERKRAVPLGLRWNLLERDGRRCRGCGATVEDGAKLVIDHVKPFAKGGLTTAENLQVLCFECNAGKRDKWLEPA